MMTTHKCGNAEIQLRSSFNSLNVKRCKSIDWFHMMATLALNKFIYGSKIWRGDS